MRAWLVPRPGLFERLSGAERVVHVPGRLGDPFGNQWMLAARIEALTPADLAARNPA
jgi:hypothetical protein